MTKYVCNDCGEVFNVPHLINIRGEGDTAICPWCGSLRFEEAFPCEECGEFYSVKDLIASYYCRDCMEKHLNQKEIGEFMADPDVFFTFAEWIKEQKEKDRNSAATP